MADTSTGVAKLVRLRFGRRFVQQANVHRDRSEWIDAVVSYRRGLDWMPWRDDLKIQIGNCLKEFGDYRGAIKSYGGVTAGTHRPEAMKQMADTNRRAGTVILPYMITDAPFGGNDPAGAAPMPLPTTRMLPNRLQVETIEPRRWLGSLGRDENGPGRWKGSSFPTILFDQVGALSMVREGAVEPLLVAVVAIRARIFSMTRPAAVELWLGEGAGATMIASVPPGPVDRPGVPIRLSVVNLWVDCERLPPGRHWLSLRCGGKVPTAGLYVNIGRAGDIADDLAISNTFVTAPAGAGDDPGPAIAALPALARPAARSLFDRPIRSILAIRADQLGDVSMSLAAMARLRALFPDATLTVLVQPPVRAVIEASGITDHVVTATLAYSPVSGQRHLVVEEEARLRGMFGPAAFDLAIDLCPGDETRPLLLLTGATYLVGFNADRFTFLDFGIGLRSRDKVNQLEYLSHAATVLTLVEALAVAVAPARPVVPRIAASDGALAEHRLEAGGYVVLHTGARHDINRWPTSHFHDLAARLIEETGFTVVLFFDADPQTLPAALRESDRLRCLDVIDADVFDAIISNARVVVGNDSGPKHLAAVRGVATVSIHVDRLNWNEWGQDGRGTILSKRVPCTGCGLNDIQLCGREAVCVKSIGVDEVLRAVHAYL